MTDENSHIALEHEQSLVLAVMHVHGRLGAGGAIGLDLAETIVGLFAKNLDRDPATQLPELAQAMSVCQGVRVRYDRLDVHGNLSSWVGALSVYLAAETLSDEPSGRGVAQNNHAVEGFDASEAGGLRHLRNRSLALVTGDPSAE